MVKTFLVSTLSLALVAFSGSSFAANRTPVNKYNQIKVIGQWNQYNIYDVDSSDLMLDIPPFISGSIVFQTDLDFADAMTPVDVDDVNRNGVKCKFLCINPAGAVIGYNPVLYAQEKARRSPPSRKKGL